MNSIDFHLKKPVKRDYKSIFWKEFERYASDEEKKSLNNILGYNQDLWYWIHKNGFRWDSIKVESVDSKFENEIPGYIGKFSGDLKVNYLGSVVINGETYTNTWEERLDTRGFW